MTQPETDRELLARYARDGEQSAFEELLRRHIAMVYGAARRWAGDPHRAEEVAQGVFLLLAQKAADRGWGDDVGGWLYRAVSYAGLTLRREDARRKKRETEVARMKGETTTREAGWEEVGPMVDAAISALSRADAEVIRLRYLQGLDGAAIARHLGVTEAAARKRGERALERLRDVLAKKGVVASAASVGEMLDAHGVEHVPAELVARVMDVLGPGGSAGAGAVAYGIKKGIVMAKVKTAAVVCAAAMSVGVVALAVNNRSERVDNDAPRPAAAPPAGLDPALVARFDEAAKQVKTGHVLAKEFGSGEETNLWVERGKRALIVHGRKGEAKTTTLVVGNEKWQFAGDGSMVGKGEGDLKRDGHLEWALGWHRAPDALIRRDEARDRKQGAEVLHAYLVESRDAATSSVVWLDGRMLPVAMEASKQGSGPIAEAVMEWNVPMDEARFEPPKGKVVETAAEMEKEFALKEAWPTARTAGAEVAVHRLTEGEGRLLYLVYSSRLTEEARKAVGRRFEASALPNQYIAGPDGKVGEDLGYIYHLLGSVTEGDVEVHWCVLVPKGGRALWDSDGMRLSFSAYPSGKLQRALGLPRAGSVEISASVTEATPDGPAAPVTQFAGEAYDAVRRWEAVADRATVMVGDGQKVLVGRSTSAVTRDDFVKGVAEAIKGWQASMSKGTPRRTPNQPK